MAYVDATAYWFWQALVESVKLDVMTENEKQILIDGGCLSLCSDALYAYAPNGHECLVERGHMHFIPKESCYDTLGVIIYIENGGGINAPVDLHVWEHGGGCQRVRCFAAFGPGYYRSGGLSMTRGRAFRYIARAEADSSTGVEDVKGWVCPFLYNDSDYGWPDTDITFLQTLGWGAIGADCSLDYPNCDYCSADPSPCFPP